VRPAQKRGTGRGIGGVGDGIWAATMELSSADSVTAMSGEPASAYEFARILVRLHDAPLGYVTVPLEPLQTLAPRVRVAAGAELAGPQRHHESCRSDPAPPDSEWLARVACPRVFEGLPRLGLTVVICTRDRPARLRECLQAVLQARHEPLEVLIVDNAPLGDGTRAVAADFAAIDARVRYECEPRAGLSNARNHGLAAARHDLVAFTDDDVRVDPGWPSALAAGFAADPHTVCVTGLVASASLDSAAERYFDSRYPWGEVFEPRRFDLSEHRDPSPGFPFMAGKFGTGANFAVRRSFVGSLGGFDPLLGAGSPSKGGEDLDMFVRIILAGGRLSYIPSALVWHNHRSDYESLTEQLYGYGHGLGAFIAKRLMSREVSVAAMAAGVGRLSVLATRAHRAGRSSHANLAAAKRLAITEARGALTGAVRYRLLVRDRRPGQCVAEERTAYVPGDRLASRSPRLVHGDYPGGQVPPADP
jgi:GT2 family glycosyltransferase